MDLSELRLAPPAGATIPNFFNKLDGKLIEYKSTTCIMKKLVDSDSDEDEDEDKKWKKPRYVRA